MDSVGVVVATIDTFSDSEMTIQALLGSGWVEAISMEEVLQGGKIVTKLMYRFRTLRSQMYWELREDECLKMS